MFGIKPLADLAYFSKKEDSLKDNGLKSSNNTVLEKEKKKGK